MTETPEKVSENAIETTGQSTVPSSPYSKIRREISEEDLQSPAVQRILLGEVDKLELRVSELELIELNFHATDKKAAILEEKLKAAHSNEVLYGICLTVGSVIIGLSSMVWERGYGWIAIAVGGLLLIGGIASKVITWRS